MARTMIKWIGQAKRNGSNEITIWNCDVQVMRETTSRTIEICVHRWFSLPGWYLSCKAADYNDFQLAAQDIEGAKREAIGMVSGELTRIGKIYQAAAKKIIRAKISP